VLFACDRRLFVTGDVAGRMQPNLKITFTEMLFADLQYRLRTDFRGIEMFR
jgi:hypothetical protein